MAILATALTVVAMLIAATAFGAAFGFWAYCLKVEKSWTSEVRMENKERWQLESTRKRWALVSIIGYAVALLLSMLLKNWLDVSQTINLTLIGLGSAGILITSLRAMVHNDRSFEASLNRGNPNRPPF